MHCLLPHELIGIWEQGAQQNSVQRACLILQKALPDKSKDELLNQTIGARDALLFKIRQQLFGECMQGYTECPQCLEQLEFSVAITDICVDSPRHDQNQFISKQDGYEMRFRLPTTGDLIDAAMSADNGKAQQIIIDRCLLETKFHGQSVEPENRRSLLANQLANEISRLDPQSDVELNLQCNQCEHAWQLDFDIAAFLWTEIDDQVQRLLQEVHVLAISYGWNEDDILAMSAKRRRVYLEKIL